MDFNTIRLFTLVRRKDAAGVRVHLEETGIHVDSKNSIGYTALHIASANGDIPMMSLLHEKGANSCCTTTNGRNPRDFALENQHNDAVKMLEEWMISDGTMHAVVASSPSNDDVARTPENDQANDGPVNDNLGDWVNEMLELGEYETPLNDTEVNTLIAVFKRYSMSITSPISSPATSLTTLDVLSFRRLVRDASLLSPSFTLADVDVVFYAALGEVSMDKIPGGGNTGLSPASLSDRLDMEGFFEAILLLSVNCSKETGELIRENILPVISLDFSRTGTPRSTSNYSSPRLPGTPDVVTSPTLNTSLPPPSEQQLFQRYLPYIETIVKYYQDTTCQVSSNNNSDILNNNINPKYQWYSLFLEEFGIIPLLIPMDVANNIILDVSTTTSTNDDNDDATNHFQHFLYNLSTHCVLADRNGTAFAVRSLLITMTTSVGHSKVEEYGKRQMDDGGMWTSNPSLREFRTMAKDDMTGMSSSTLKFESEKRSGSKTNVIDTTSSTSPSTLSTNRRRASSSTSSLKSSIEALGLTNDQTRLLRRLFLWYASGGGGDSSTAVFLSPNEWRSLCKDAEFSKSFSMRPTDVDLAFTSAKRACESKGNLRFEGLLFCLASLSVRLGEICNVKSKDILDKMIQNNLQSLLQNDSIMNPYRDFSNDSLVKDVVSEYKAYIYLLYDHYRKLSAPTASVAQVQPGLLTNSDQLLSLSEWILLGRECDMTPSLVSLQQLLRVFLVSKHAYDGNDSRAFELSYEEFILCLCRVAAVGYDQSNTVSFKNDAERFVALLHTIMSSPGHTDLEYGADIDGDGKRVEILRAFRMKATERDKVRMLRVEQDHKKQLKSLHQSRTTLRDLRSIDASKESNNNTNNSNSKKPINVKNMSEIIFNICSTYLEMNELTRVQTDEVYDIFAQYCHQSDSQHGYVMSLIEFRRCYHDAGIIVSQVSSVTGSEIKPFTQSDADVVFSAARADHGHLLTFGAFLRSLELTAGHKAETIYDYKIVLRHIILQQILPLYSSQVLSQRTQSKLNSSNNNNNNSNNNNTVDPSESEAFLMDHERYFRALFLSFSKSYKQQNEIFGDIDLKSNVAIKCQIECLELLKLCTDMSITPHLITGGEVRSLFQTALVAAIEDGSQLQWDRTLTFTSFIQFLIMVSVLSYSRSPFIGIYPSNNEKIRSLFQIMLSSRGHARLLAASSDNGSCILHYLKNLTVTEPERTIITLSEDASRRLGDVFLKYCAKGDILTLDRLTHSSFRKLLVDTGIVKSLDYNHQTINNEKISPLSHADIDLAFSCGVSKEKLYREINGDVSGEYLRDGHRHSGLTQLHAHGFLEAIYYIIDKIYGPGRTEENIPLFISTYLSRVESSNITDLPMLSGEVLALFEKHKIYIGHVYNHYATPVSKATALRASDYQSKNKHDESVSRVLSTEWDPTHSVVASSSDESRRSDDGGKNEHEHYGTDHGHVSLTFENFLRLKNDFGFSGLVTNQEVQNLFRQVNAGWDQDGDILQLSYKEFLSMLSEIASIGFGKYRQKRPGYYTSLQSCVQALLERMAMSDGTKVVERGMYGSQNLRQCSLSILTSEKKVNRKETKDVNMTATLDSGNKKRVPLSRRTPPTIAAKHASRTSQRYSIDPETGSLFSTSDVSGGVDGDSALQSALHNLLNDPVLLASKLQELTIERELASQRWDFETAKEISKTIDFLKSDVSSSRLEQLTRTYNADVDILSNQEINDIKNFMEQWARREEIINNDIGNAIELLRQRQLNECSSLQKQLDEALNTLAVRPTVTMLDIEKKIQVARKSLDYDAAQHSASQYRKLEETEGIRLKENIRKSFQLKRNEIDRRHNEEMQALKRRHEHLAIDWQMEKDNALISLKGLYKKRRVDLMKSFQSEKLRLTGGNKLRLSGNSTTFDQRPM